MGDQIDYTANLRKAQNEDEAAAIPRTYAPEVVPSVDPRAHQDLQQALRNPEGIVPVQGVPYDPNAASGLPPADPANAVAYQPNAASGAPGAPADGSGAVGAGFGMGPDLSGLSDVSRSSSSSTSRNIYRPQDEAALRASQEQQATTERQQAAVAGDSGRQAAAVLDAGRAEVQDRAKAHEAAMAERTAARDAAIRAQDDANAKYQQAAAHVPLGTVLNPDAGQKVASILGLILSGAGSGLAHQPNLAAQMLEAEYRRAYQQRAQTLQALGRGVEFAGMKVGQAERATQDERADYNDWFINHAAIVNDRLKSLAELRKDPEAKAAAEAVIAAQKVRSDELTLERNKRIAQSTSTAHQASPLESAIRMEQATNARLNAAIKLTDDQRKVYSHVFEEQQKLGITGAKNSLQRAYQASNGFQNIPNAAVRLMSQLGAGGDQSAPGILKAAGQLLESNTFGEFANDRDREFAGALTEIVRAATKAGERGQTTERDAIAYALASGLGPNSTVEQVRQRLWTLTDKVNELDSKLKRANGVEGSYDQIVGDQPLPTRPRTVAIPGVTRRE